MEETKFADINECVGPIATGEVLAALQFCKHRKLTLDEFRAYKVCARLVRLPFIELRNMCWTAGHVAEDWRIAKVVNMSKKEDRTYCDNCLSLIHI